ncbi:MAG: TonB-dependent receptor [Sedimentisphaerales bacterium]|nr:TonB-dependent receptor [Sedimentisphaerales bacterium]
MKHCFSHYIIVVAIVVFGSIGGRAEGETLPDTNLPFKSDDQINNREWQNICCENPEMLLFMNIPQVTTVTGQAGEWFTTPAAVTVITSEEIRRSGALSLLDALRFVPGVEISKVHSHYGVMSIRGYLSICSSLVLVLVDGRELYSPEFGGGIWWNLQDIILEDIDRIEVIRGPGATLWGANAVNGVINIVTKRADETQGLYARSGIGNEEHVFTDLRYGGQLDEDIYYRVWGKYADHNDFDRLGGASAHDDWDLGRIGWRLDGGGYEQVHWSFQGGVWHSDKLGIELPIPNGHMTNEIAVRDERKTGGYALINLERDFNYAGGWSFHAVYERQVQQIFDGIEASRHTVDINARHHLAAFDRHDIIWGVAGRLAHLNSEDGPAMAFEPDRRHTCTVSAFAQDTIMLADYKWYLMLGSKFEHNSYTGFEFQPSARLWWMPEEDQIAWASISRPVHTPTRIHTDFDMTLNLVDSGLAVGGPPSGVLVPMKLQGTKDMESVKVMAYEAGYRCKLMKNLMWDMSGFFYEYHDMIGTPAANPYVIMNFSDGKSYGLETSLDWQPCLNWQLGVNYSYIHATLEADQSMCIMKSSAAPHKVQFKALWDITNDLELNTLVYYNDQNNLMPYPSEYVRLDMGLTWRPTDYLELALWGQNLINEHPGDTIPTVQAQPTIIPTSVYFQATLRF